MNKSVAFPFVALAAAIALAAGAVAWWRSTESYHFAVVKEGVLYRTGCRDLRQLDHACQRGRIRTVISLLGNEETAKKPSLGEPAYCQERGIRFEHIPVGRGPATQDVRRFLRIVSDPQRQPVLVHCRHGIHRTGMMVAAYQRTVLGFSVAEAKAAMLPFDNAAPSLNCVGVFIDAYDPATQVVDATTLKPADNTCHVEED